MKLSNVYSGRRLQGDALRPPPKCVNFKPENFIYKSWHHYRWLHDYWICHKVKHLIWDCPGARRTSFDTFASPCSIMMANALILTRKRWVCIIYRICITVIYQNLFTKLTHMLLKDLRQKNTVISFTEKYHRSPK